MATHQPYDFWVRVATTDEQLFATALDLMEED